MITIKAASGSRAHIQTAVNKAIAEGGGNVAIPAGSFNFNGASSVDSIGGVNFIGVSSPCKPGYYKKGAGTIRTLLQLYNTDEDYGLMFNIDGSNGKPIIFTGIHLKGYAGDTGDDGINLSSVRKFLIFNSKFELLGDEAIIAGHNGAISWASTGVIYHCSFVQLYKAAALSANHGYAYGTGIYGILFWEGEQYWESDFSNLWGRGDMVYSEDNYYTRNRHCTVTNFGGRSCFRYNYIENHAEVNDGGHWINDVHPCRSSGGVSYSGNWLELYENKIYFNQTDGTIHAITVDGGGAFVYNNILDPSGGDGFDYTWGMDMSTSGGVPTSIQTMCKPWVYFWNNTGDSLYTVDLLYISEAGVSIDEDSEYFLHDPAEDTISYTAYVYPHTLRKIAFAYSGWLNWDPEKREGRGKVWT